MPLTEQQKELYSALLETLVNSSDIHDLLKIYKEDNKEVIRLSGTKNDLISNLLSAVDNDIISIIHVQELIKDSEEYGDQHIFVYSPSDRFDFDFYNDAQVLGDIIIPTAKRRRLPLLTLMPDDFNIADFKAPNRGVENSWMFKFYDKRVKDVKISEEYDVNTSLKTVTYERKESRMVYIIEWNGSNELIMKINRTTSDSARSLKESITKTKQAIHPGSSGILIDRDFVPIDYRPNIKSILLHHSDNDNIYKVLGTTFVDSNGGSAQIKSQDDTGQDHLFDENARKLATEAFLNNDAMSTGLVIKFLAAGSNGQLQHDVNVVFGREGINHMIFAAKLKPSEYNYVRTQVARFN